MTRNDALAGELAVYREIFDEITLKAQPLCEDESDPERVTGYRLPVGPIHRACGKTGHHMLGVAQNVERSIRWLEASTDAVTFLNDYKLSEGAKRQIEEIEHHIATAVDRIRSSGWPNYPDATPAADNAEQPEAVEQAIKALDLAEQISGRHGEAGDAPTSLTPHGWEYIFSAFDAARAALAAIRTLPTEIEGEGR